MYTKKADFSQNLILIIREKKSCHTKDFFKKILCRKNSRNIKELQRDAGKYRLINMIVWDK